MTFHERIITGVWILLFFLSTSRNLEDLKVLALLRKNWNLFSKICPGDLIIYCVCDEVSNHPSIHSFTAVCPCAWPIPLGGGI